METIIVTGIYNLQSRYPDYFNRKASEYIALISYVLELGYPVYCYTEASLAVLLPQHDNLHIKIRDYEDLPAHDKIVKIGKCSKHAMIGDRAHEGHRAYSIVNTSKVYLVQEIMKEVEAKKYIWLDSGIAHIDPCPIDKAIHSINSLSDDKHTFCVINFPKPINNMLEYWSELKYSIAAGLMCFVPHHMSSFIEEYDNVLKIAYDNDFIVSEEQVLPFVIINNTSNYYYRFTDYRLLSNLLYPTYDNWIIIRNIEHLPNQIAVDLIKRCLSSIEQGYMRLTHHEMCYFLYYSQIASYYCDKELSNRLAGIIMLAITARGNANSTKFRSDEMLGNMLITKYPNILSNIAYNDITSSLRDEIKVLAMYL